MQHIGIVACSAEGAALCYQAICRDALTRVGKNDHPRITIDSIPLAVWMPAFDCGDYAGVATIMAPVLYGFVVVNYYVVLINLTPMLELDGYFMVEACHVRATVVSRER